MTAALLTLGTACILAVHLKRALDRLDADMTAWANATDLDEPDALTGLGR